jgi:hypothetical protein
MENDETIKTLHPQGKTGRTISKQKYDIVKEALLSVMKDTELTHNELFAKLDEKLKGKFDGNIGWYGETIKLDLEARQIIERTSSKPQKYHLK